MVVHTVRPGHWGDTAIDKRPVAGPVEVGELGLAGDQQLQPVHGGPDKAVYAYAAEDAAYWETELDRELPPGTLGENLRTVAWDVTHAVVGERWRIGGEDGVVVEVRMPRTPCENLSHRLGLERFHVDFGRSGRVGALLRVRRQGRVAAGDPIALVERPDHGVTIADLATGTQDAEALQQMLDAGVPLARSVRDRARRAVRRAAG